MLLPRRPKFSLVIAVVTIPNFFMGCARGIQPPNTLFIAYGIGDGFSRETKSRIGGRLTEFSENFKRSSPDTNVVLAAYKGWQFKERIISASKLNLGPDVIVANLDMLKSLHNKGYADALPAHVNWDQTYNPLLKEFTLIVILELII